MQNIYLEVLIVAGLLFLSILLLWFILSKVMKGEPGPEKRPNIYDDSYSPGMLASGKGPLPMGSGRKRKDRR